MTRRTRFALISAMVLAVVAAGSTLAFNPEGPNAERLVGLLEDAGVTTDVDTVSALADEHGTGGAVRILWWASAAGGDPSEIAAMREAGMGWGQIARALAEAHPDFDLTPGIGPVIGGRGHGHEHGQGHGNHHGHGAGGDGGDGGDDPGG